MGQALPQLADGTDDQTLAVVLAANTRLENLTVDLQMGKAGADCISIERAANTTGYLYADNFTMNGLVAPTLVMSNSEIHSMTLSGETDGHHTGPTQDSTIPSIVKLSAYRYPVVLVALSIEIQSAPAFPICKSTVRFSSLVPAARITARVWSSVPSANCGNA